MSRLRFPHVIGLFQAAVAVSAVGIAPLVPPAEGRILLAPILARDSGSLVAMARAQDALVIGAGPWRGTIVVAGNRAALAGTMLNAGVLMIAAPDSACGEGRTA